MKRKERCGRREKTLKEGAGHSAQGIMDAGQYAQLFVAPGEQVVAVLGNACLQEYLRDGSPRKGYGIVGDKRLYYRGISYDVKKDKKGHMRLKKTQKPRIIDLQDITGIGFESCRDKSWLFQSVFFVFLGLLVFCLKVLFLRDFSVSGWEACCIFLSLFWAFFCAYKYFNSRITGILIQSVKESVFIDQKPYSSDELEVFQQMALLAKDRVRTKTKKI